MDLQISPADELACPFEPVGITEWLHDVDDVADADTVRTE